MSNAIRHTPSGEAEGTFTIAAQLGSGWLRIAVTDLGGAAWDSRASLADDAMAASFAEGGRGLRLVAALADACGHETSGAGSHTCWAVLTW
jgi:serine/threonine-protein kinase RsbW